MKSLIILFSLLFSQMLFAGTDTGTAGILLALESADQIVDSDEILDLAEIKIPTFDPTTIDLINEELFQHAGSDTGTNGIFQNFNVLAAKGKIQLANLELNPVAISATAFNPGMVRFVNADDTNVIFEAFNNNKTSTYIMPIKAIETFIPEKLEALEASSFDGSWVNTQNL